LANARCAAQWRAAAVARPRTRRSRRERRPKGAGARLGLHELVGELARVAADRLVEYRDVERICRVVQSLAFTCKLEPCPLDDLADFHWIDAVKRVCVCQPPAGPRQMVDDHERPPWLQDLERVLCQL